MFKMHNIKACTTLYTIGATFCAIAFYPVVIYSHMIENLKDPQITDDSDDDYILFMNEGFGPDSDS